jgi:hypothetical protein
MRPVPDPTAAPAITGAAATDATLPAAGESGAVAPVSGAVSEPAREIAAAVAAGALDAAAAAERLVAATVAAQRPAGVSAAAWARIEREVAELLADDPALADLLAPT